MVLLVVIPVAAGLAAELLVLPAISYPVPAFQAYRSVVGFVHVFHSFSVLQANMRSGTVTAKEAKKRKAG
jgi:hypothetical protein